MGFFFLSLLLLTFGLARSELFASLLGAGLALITLYSYAAVLLLSERGSGRLSAPSLFVSRQPDRAGAMAAISLDLPRAAAQLPLIQRRWRLTLTFRERSITLEHPAGGAGSEEWSFVPEQRGLYRGDTLLLLATDRFGFAERALSFPAPLELSVPPAPADGEGALRRPTGSSARTHRGRSLRRNELLIESRPYHPGDDLRRVNWKALARTDELLVRIGEEIPPAHRRIVLACDPGGCPDEVAREALLLLEELHAQGYRCELLHGETGERVDGSQEAARRRFLSALWRAEGPPLSGVNAASLSSAILLTPRGRVARQDNSISSALARGTLTVRELPCPRRAQERRPLLERILFVPERRT